MFKKLVRSALGRFGLQLQRTRKPDQGTNSGASEQTLWLREFGINTVLDIGANAGQFAEYIGKLFPDAMVYSFEPLPDCFEKLQSKMAGAINFRAFNLALGNQTADMEFERNEFSPSSSFLKMANLHREAFPYTRNASAVSVKTRRLDDLLPELRLREPVLVKIDVQGYEDEVLRGGARIIQAASLIVIETSFETLYEGQHLFDDIYRKLTDWGFVYHGAVDQLCSPRDGRPLQENSIFVRRNSLHRV